MEDELTKLLRLLRYVVYALVAIFIVAFIVECHSLNCVTL